MHWNTKHYARNCVYRNQEFELILLCWEPGQETPVHCHGGEECWVHLIQGALEEDRFEEKSGMVANKVSNAKLAETDLTYMNDSMGFHSLKNISEGRAISLHLYAKPIHSCRVYNPADGTLKHVELSDFSYQGQIIEKVF